MLKCKIYDPQGRRCKFPEIWLFGAFYLYLKTNALIIAAFVGIQAYIVIIHCLQIFYLVDIYLPITVLVPHLKIFLRVFTK